MGIAASTLTLTEVETAIRDILLTGSSYSKPGLSLTRGDLTNLRALRKDLIREGVLSSSTGASFVNDFSRGDGTDESSQWGDD